MKILKKERKYVYGLSDNTKISVESFGREAVLITFFKCQLMKRPQMAIVSSYAFDDFIVFNDLPDKISNLLKTVRPFIRDSAREVSDQIANLLLSADVQPALLKQFKVFFANQSKVPLAFKIVPSHLIPSKYIDYHSQEEIIFSDFNEFEISIKKAWNQLFIPENIELRINNYYNGEITVALIIQALSKYELSGDIYFQDDKEIVCRAFYGIKMIEPDQTDEYYFNLDTELLTKVVVRPQLYMNVYSDSNVLEPNAVVKVEVSPKWQSVQKIPEDRILRVFKDFKEIYRLTKHPIKIRWYQTMGEFYVESIQLQNDIPKYPTPELETTGSMQQVGSDQGINAQISPVYIEGDIVQNKVDQSNTRESLVDEELSLKKVIEGSIKIDPSERDLVKVLDLHEVQDAEETDLHSFRERFREQSEFVKIDPIFKTQLFLEMSKVTPSRVAALGSFYGNFIDGTILVLDNNVLPESLENDQLERTMLVDKYAQAIYAGSINSKKTIYQLSNIQRTEYIILGENITDELKCGNERFLAKRTAFDVEVAAIKRARSVYGVRNISVCITDTKNSFELHEMKKLFSSTNLRGGKSTEIFFEVASPAVMHFMTDEEYINEHFDGCIVNITKLYSSLHRRFSFDERDKRDFINFLNALLHKIKPSQTKVYFLLYDVHNIFLDLGFDHSIQGFIFSNIPDESIFRYIWNLENKSRDN